MRDAERADAVRRAHRAGREHQRGHVEQPAAEDGEEAQGAEDPAGPEGGLAAEPQCPAHETTCVAEKVKVSAAVAPLLTPEPLGRETCTHRSSYGAADQELIVPTVWE
ncbi:hypothetical protein D9M69_684540 [compost metagenome]